jgi:hypothetical protein
MKTLTRCLALAALAAILGSCSFAVGALNHKKSRFVASAIWHGKSAAPAGHTVRSASAAKAVKTAGTPYPLVRKRHVLPVRPASAVVRSSRSVAPGPSKDISASTDVDFITYKIVNLDPSSGEADIQDYLDPNYPYIDIFLTPGQNYRITVDVTLLQSSLLIAAGAAVGIGAYGDSADIAVPADGSDVWVDMTIHAMGITIKNQVTGGTVIHYVTATGGLATGTVGSPVTPKPQDKFFYTSDSLLYYFSFNAAGGGAVYQWTDVSLPLSTTTPAFDGTTGPLGPIQIYAICPDPSFAGWFYVVGLNAGSWELDEAFYDPSVGPTSLFWYNVGDITADLEFGGNTAVAATGVAADLYGEAYVTFYNTPTPTTGSPVSGMVQYDTIAGGPAIASFIPDTTAGWSSADSIFTDVMYGGSNVYVLASPNTNTVGAGGTRGIGTADVFIFDTFLDLLSTNPSPVSQVYASMPALTGGSSLILPNKFIGSIQGGTIFVSQTDFAATGAEYLSGVAIDLSSVKSVP